MKKYFGLLLGFAVVGLSSCLKQDPALNPEESNNVLEIYEPVPTPTLSPANASYPLYGASFDIMPAAEFIVEVNYAGDETAPQDITVNLELDEQALLDYNDEQGTHYSLIPNNVFSVDSWTVTIPAGQKKAQMVVQLFTDQFDLAESYAMPVKIASASSGIISSNFGTVIYAVVAKNKWDGKYESNGTFVDHTNPLFGYFGAQELHLITLNATQNAVFNETLGTYGLLFMNGATPTYYGSFGLILTFDPATDKITAVTNYYGQPSANGRSAGLNPAGINAFDNATHDIDISYYLLQPGNTIRSEMVEHWTYLGPRD